MEDIGSGYIINTPVLNNQEFENIVKNEMTSSTETKQKIVSEVLRMSNIGEIDMMPIYGLHHPSAEYDSVIILKHMIDSIKEAQKTGMEKKPVVMCVTICDQKLKQKLSGVENVSYVDADSKDAQEKIRLLQPGEILILKTGSLPRKVFHQLFRVATLPALLEGANLTNLMQMLKKPYLSVHRGYTDFPDQFTSLIMRGIYWIEDVDKICNNNFPDQVPENFKLKRIDRGGVMAGVASELIKEYDQKNKINYIKFIAKFIKQSKEPTSLVSMYFTQIGQNARRPYENQLINGLYELQKRFHAVEKASEIPIIDLNRRNQDNVLPQRSTSMPDSSKLQKKQNKLFFREI